MKCAILGAGSRGTALAQVLASNGHEPCLRAIDQRDRDAIMQQRENTAYLPWILLHDRISCELSLEKVLENAEFLVLALPSKVFPESLSKMRSWYQGQPIVLASKGRNASDFSPLSSVVTKLLWEVPLVVLSGASHAEEVIKGLPTGVVLASKQEMLTHFIKNAFQNQRFKCSESSDMVWVQLMWAFKNLLALACGMSDGLGYGANTKALIFTQGIQEISKIWTVIGAQQETLISYAGIADMYVTCSSALSRNWNAGRLLAQGHTKDEITWGLMNMVAEGLYMIEAVSTFLSQHSLDFPLLEMMVKIIDQKVPCAAAFDDFLKNC